MIQIFFQHIKKEVLHRLKISKNEILAAVAWITDREIYLTLKDAAIRGAHIIVILNKDDINQDSGIEWAKIERLGATLLWSKSNRGIMHHKFCIIDRQTVLTGSYNWTYSAANFNEESLLVMDDEDVVKQFLQEFENLLLPLGKSLYLEERIILSPRKAELKIKIPLVEAEIALLEEKYDAVSGKIEQFLFRVQRAVGPLLLQWKLLMMQKSLKLSQRTKSKADEIEYEVAKQGYEQAKFSYNEARSAPLPKALAEDKQAEIKKIYREAVMMAHPDKFQDNPEKQTQANHLMAELSKAYKLNDYEKVKSIWKKLKEGTAFSLVMDDTTSLEQLEAYYHSLLAQKEALDRQIQSLEQSDDYKNWGKYRDDFNTFIEMVKEDLQTKIRLLKEDLK
jgi:hypothetical protein